MTDDPSPQRASRRRGAHRGRPGLPRWPGPGHRERERAQCQAGGVIGDLAQIATRARETLDELRPPSGEDVRALRKAVLALEHRVTALEREARRPRVRRVRREEGQGKSAEGHCGG